MPALPATLVDHSMLAGSQDGRYQMHEFLRQYASDHLQASPAEGE